ncbi:hypothetical protein SPRG_09847 [Saprolegnia parasitica CBS 223.65]|uniref:Uncharacterized protein n=1 Tax=Saprolegnia parasitica (strain CBS 223.65) TaxID=695850 RepID=A0A067C5N9_SAPPC|nr:hypothetical protein SPRG_09847 [Saprolegnia parasitica CBS 223.65]KDO24465.1 hypothetical protein SPRG_09847 [Saprolegnia parasitica CBS 223.65]|eukprot:XP_012204886.1 hypothetical protein SPRG_09847 [Saprolegnia parasitica CBS 223.65]
MGDIDMEAGLEDAAPSPSATSQASKQSPTATLNAQMLGTKAAAPKPTPPMVHILVVYLGCFIVQS